MISQRAELVFPMHWSWRLSVALLSLLAGLVAIACAAELTGLAPRDALLRGANDAERAFGIAVGTLLQPFALTLLRHSRLCIDKDGLRFLRVGLLCRTEEMLELGFEMEMWW